jgi:chaperonin GroEL
MRFLPSAFDRLESGLTFRPSQVIADRPKDRDDGAGAGGGGMDGMGGMGGMEM